ncbi:uncharacterized protein BX664DRAFT_326857 [Halteromyces radiatus]|uniref:uncharacterized protein n=1 Tax=Halteromyces radiatus TaxID=101107 RepID=UPI00222072CA|nr:uncharacterized protein BX664DRAFT_326857 [Halteromyces radiatus]KAI8097626.1 hypothetical protein BX664DRAFT_326857 [Halteromyces radiatus]
MSSSPTSYYANDSISSGNQSYSEDHRPSTVSTDLTTMEPGDELRSPYLVSDTDSDKDLVIHSLNESLHIHKEIMEKIHAEKEAYITQLNKDRQQELEVMERTKQTLEEQMDRYNKLDAAYSALRRELDSKKEDYQRMEAKFYAHVKSIKATDDDLSTIQHEINHISSQLNNLCMGLKSKMDVQAGSQFLFSKYESHQDSFRKYLIKEEMEKVDQLEPRYITMLTEKLVMEILVEFIFDQPLHIGVSVNEAYKQVRDWMRRYNEEWAQRFRQQMSALLANQAQQHDERLSIEEASEQLVDRLIEQLGQIYPELLNHGDYTKNQRKKIDSIVTRTSRLNLAMKGQDIEIKHQMIQEGGQTTFDPTIMKADGKGKPDGDVLFVISPPFLALDPTDSEHGFIIPGKVYCV